MLKAVKAYWEALTPEQQAELDAESIAQADPESLTWENGPMKEAIRRLRRDQYIRTLLKSRESLAAEA